MVIVRKVVGFQGFSLANVQLVTTADIQGPCFLHNVFHVAGSVGCYGFEHRVILRKVVGFGGFWLANVQLVTMADIQGPCFLHNVFHVAGYRGVMGSSTWSSSEKWWGFRGSG